MDNLTIESLHAPEDYCAGYMGTGVSREEYEEVMREAWAFWDEQDALMKE